MAIIDPDGLFHGSRLRECSDKAQLFWPRFLLASNGLGRIHLDYDRLLKGPLASLQTPPTKQEVLEMFREYKTHFLAFPYVTNGELWAQWDVAQRLLSKYQTASDRRSPAPPTDEYNLWKAEYAELKKSRSVDLLDYEVIFTTSIPITRTVTESTISENSQTTPQISKPSQTTSLGVGVGVGVGIGIGKGEKQKPSAAGASVADPRFKVFVEQIDKYWKFKNPNIPFTFGKSDGKELNRMLADNPKLDVDIFTECLRHRARSDVVHTERVRMWIGNILSYATGALDRFGKSKETHDGRPASTPTNQRFDRIVGNTAKALGITPGNPASGQPGAERNRVVLLGGDARALPPAGRGDGHPGVHGDGD